MRESLVGFHAPEILLQMIDPGRNPVSNIWREKLLGLNQLVVITLIFPENSHCVAFITWTHGVYCTKECLKSSNWLHQVGKITLSGNGLGLWWPLYSENILGSVSPPICMHSLDNRHLLYQKFPSATHSYQNSLHTFNFYGSCKYVFVTNVSPTWHSQSSQKYDIIVKRILASRNNFRLFCITWICMNIFHKSQKLKKVHLELVGVKARKLMTPSVTKESKVVS